MRVLKYVIVGNGPREMSSETMRQRSAGASSIARARDVPAARVAFGQLRERRERVERALAVGRRDAHAAARRRAGDSRRAGRARVET